MHKRGLCASPLLTLSHCPQCSEDFRLSHGHGDGQAREGHHLVWLRDRSCPELCAAAGETLPEGFRPPGRLGTAGEVSGRGVTLENRRAQGAASRNQGTCDVNHVPWGGEVKHGRLESWPESLTPYSLRSCAWMSMMWCPWNMKHWCWWSPAHLGMEIPQRMER